MWSFPRDVGIVCGWAPDSVVCFEDLIMQLTELVYLKFQERASCWIPADNEHLVQLCCVLAEQIVPVAICK